MTKIILLTQGKVALVDDEDYTWLRQYNWYTCRDHHRDNFRAMRKYNGKTQLMHRLIMNVPQGLEIDHVNGNGLDNRRVNLRLASRTDNARNRGPQRNNTSGYKGVSLNKRDRLWQATIVLNSKGYYLGRFDTPEDAAVAYNEAARRSYGPFAWLNKIPDGSGNHGRRNPAPQRNNVSGYRGVTWQKQDRKWRAKIQADGKWHSLGLFDNKHNAARAYNEGAKKYHGTSARLNKIPEGE